MNDLENNTRSIEQHQVLLIINFIMIGLMLACFAFILGNFFKTIFPVWETVGFSILAFLIALESLVVRYLRRHESRILHNTLLATLAELILILFVIKLISLLISGFSTIWVEILSWQQDFLANFFEPSYMLRALGLLLVWFLAFIFSQPLIQLEEDEELLAQEKLGYTFTDRQDARRSLISLVFILGFAMIIMMVLMKSSIELLYNTTTSASTFVIVLLIYFFAGFVFLSLNQYAIMKARWYFSDMTVNPELAKRWLLYTLSFIVVVIVLIIFLPTDFAVGFYPIARVLSEVLVFLFAIVQYVFFLPIALLITLITSLFSGEPVADQFQESLPERMPSVPQVTAIAPWWDVVKSILFWLIFLGVIIFSIRYYIKNRPDFKSLLDHIHIADWLRDFWNWIKSGFKIVRQVSSQTYQKGLDNIRTFFRNRQIKLPSLADIARRLPPRQAVILTYIDWIHWNRDHGFDRRKSQTPHEYGHAFIHYLPEADEIAHDFTNTFIKARYTKDKIDKSTAQHTQELLSALKDTFKQKQTLEDVNG